MRHYQYLIVGGGLAGDAAARGIREIDATGSIGMISMEPNPPYMRPSLSKGLWKGRPIEKIWRHTRELDAILLLGRKVTHLDPLEKCLHDETGEEYTFDKLYSRRVGPRSGCRLAATTLSITVICATITACAA